MVGFCDRRGVVYVLYGTKKVSDVTVMIFWDGFMWVIIIRIWGSDVVFAIA